MPVFLKDAHGLDTFACDCCAAIVPKMSIEEHHKIKRADGGKDTRENIAIICVSCHNALHHIEGAVKSEKKRLLIPDMLKKLYPSNQKAREYCLYLAMTAAMKVDKENPENKPKESNADTDYSMFDTDDLVHLTPPAVPPFIRDLVMRVVKDMRSPKGKPIGVGRYLRFLVERDLRQRGLRLTPPKKSKIPPPD